MKFETISFAPGWKKVFPMAIAAAMSISAAYAGIRGFSESGAEIRHYPVPAGYSALPDYAKVSYLLSSVPAEKREVASAVVSPDGDADGFGRRMENPAEYLSALKGSFGSGAHLPGIRVIPRSEWGAASALGDSWCLTDFFGCSAVPQTEKDSYRKFAEYDDANTVLVKDSEGVPRKYSKRVERIIVHHTATKNGNDPITDLRRIQRIHIDKGYGDIAYNYLIDAEGRIYEGRSGWAFVQGVHAQFNNAGTVGISLIGNYDEKELPKPAADSLRKLVDGLSSYYGFASGGRVPAKKEDMSAYWESPRVVGHRDTKGTSCPGKFVDLPKIVGRLAE